MSNADWSAWQEISALLDEVLDLPPSERPAWLEQLTVRSPLLGQRVRAMLDEHAQLDAEGFLAQDAATPLRTTLAGLQLGAYTLDSPLGHGGMGTVWLAHRSDGRFEGRVAVKVLNAALLGRPAEQRFVREGSVLARLSHPHIARLLDAGIAPGGQPYLVLEYIEGVRIDQYCEQHSLSMEMRVRLFLDVLAAVAHAHSHLIVHRDLKPSNILVTPTGQVKLLDFGVAALLASEREASAPEATREAEAGFTPEYAAPEQLLGLPVTTATDVYALGLVLFVMLAGRHPVGGEDRSSTQLLRATLDEEPPRVSQVVADPRHGRTLRGDLDNIVAVALRKEASERYVGVGAFADDLQRFLQHLPVRAAPDRLGYRAMKFVRRHRGTVLSAALTLVALLAATGVTAWQMLEARTQRDLARAELRRSAAFGDLVSIVLSTAAPAEEPVTTRVLLERAEQLVNTEFAKDATVRSQLLYSLARISSQAGLTGKQRQLYAEALEAARQARDARMMSMAGCAVAATEAVIGNLEQARRQMEQLMQALSPGHSNEDVRALCLRYRSTIATFAGDGERALADASAADELDRDNATLTEWDRLGTAIMLADAQRNAGRLVTADDTYRAAHAGFRRLGLEETSFASVLLNNWAANLAALGQPLRAAELLERVIDLDRAHGRTDAFTTTIYAQVLLQLERAADARRALETAMADASAAENPRAANMLRGWLAATHRELGDLQRAHALIDQSERDARAMLPAGHEAFGALHLNRAHLARREGDLERALREADAAFAIFAGKPALAHRSAAAQLLRSALYVQLGKPHEALLAARAADATYDRLFGSEAPSMHVGLAKLALARAQYATGDRDAARANAVTAHTALLATVGTDHSSTREALALQTG